MDFFFIVPEVPESDSLVKVATDDCVSHSPSSHYVIAAGTSKQGLGTWNGNQTDWIILRNKITLSYMFCDVDPISSVSCHGSLSPIIICTKYISCITVSGNIHVYAFLAISSVVGHTQLLSLSCIQCFVFLCYWSRHLVYASCHQKVFKMLGIA